MSGSKRIINLVFRNETTKLKTLYGAFMLVVACGSGHLSIWAGFWCGSLLPLSDIWWGLLLSPFKFTKTTLYYSPGVDIDSLFNCNCSHLVSYNRCVLLRHYGHFRWFA